MDIESKTVTGTILIVDDDEGVRKLLERWVAAMGYTVKSAPDAETALDIMRGFQIDVACCDVRMPGHDGMWLVEQMGRFHPSIAVVLASGLLELDPMFMLRPGVVGYRPNGCAHTVRSPNGATVLGVVWGGVNPLIRATAPSW